MGLKEPLILAGFTPGMVFSVVCSAQPLSELEKNTNYVNSYLENNGIQETRLLRDMTGIEVNVYFRTNSAKLDPRERAKIINVTRAMWIFPMLNVSLGACGQARVRRV
jgi:hypothetical protein